MTSVQQIEANRRNALRSTGPITEVGKRRSRRNAIRHGLAAETVVEIIEDVEDYRGFEAAVIASYDARNAVERELVLRLASLLWRLRRATAIETDLFRIQAEISRDLTIRRDSSRPIANLSSGFVSRPPSVNELDQSQTDNFNKEMCGGSDERPRTISPSQDLADCFLRLANIDCGVFERLGRYETALSRQVFRVLLLLRSAAVR